MSKNSPTDIGCRGHRWNSFSLIASVRRRCRRFETCVSIRMSMRRFLMRMRRWWCCRSRSRWRGRLSRINDGGIQRRIVRLIELHRIREATVDQRALLGIEYFREEDIEFHNQIAAARRLFRIGQTFVRETLFCLRRENFSIRAQLIRSFAGIEKWNDEQRSK